MSKSGRNIWKRILRILKIILIVFFSSSLLFTILFRFVPPPATPLMLLRCGEQLFSGEKVTLKKDWVPLEDISPNLRLAVIASEDNEFVNHYGIDFDAIEKARELNKTSKRMRGASTISQQTAKNVFLWPSRDWIRKGLEVYFTALIEVFWGKKRIMEMYLNVIEMGKGIYGAEMAAQTYYHKPAKKLSRAEAAMIACILPAPRKWNPLHPSPGLLKKQQWVLRNMNRVEPLNVGR